MSQSTDLQRLIVEFIHPGQEFCPRKGVSDHRAIWNDDGVSGLRCWNKQPEKHKRKFLISRGLSRNSADGKDVESLLTCWGEWEPQSRFRELSDPPPFFVHEPFLVRDSASAGTHNTDPFIFGREFWFTNCHQSRYPFLRTLSCGSLILFGTGYDGGRTFALDTVFVVGDRFTPEQYRENPAMWPEQLRLATLNHDQLAQNPKNEGLVFYRGKRPVDGRPFSFIPCRTVNCASEVRHGIRASRLNEKVSD